MFVELVSYLTKNNSHIGYILPNTWLTIISYAGFRKFLLDKAGHLRILNVLCNVFQDASVDTCMLILNKDKSIQTLTLGEYNEQHIVEAKQLPLQDFYKNNCIINIALSKSNTYNDIINTINNGAVMLEEVSTVKSGLKAYETGKGIPRQTDSMKHNRVYHSKTKDDNSYLYYLNGRDVCRYGLKWSGEYLKYGECLAAKRKKELFIEPRILVRQIPSTPPHSINAVYTDKTRLNAINSMIIYRIKEYHPLYILGNLNSKLTTFWFVNTFDKFQRKTFPQFKVRELKMFPIRTIDPKNPDDKIKHDKMVNLVETMLKLNKQLAEVKSSHDKKLLTRQIEATDRQIDALVYDLYNLTPDEIQIVEDSFK